MFATCSWPSLCEQSELQCWRRNRRLCGSVQISAARVLPLTFDISILNALPFRGAVASLPILIFLNFEHPTCPPENTSRKSCIPTCRRTPSQIHPFHIPDAVVSRPRRDRLSSQTRTRLLPETNASGPTFAKRHRHKIVDDKSLISIDCPSVLNL